MNASRSNRCTSCSFLSSAPCSGGISFLGSRSRSDLRADVLDHQELEPVEQFRGRRLLLQARHVADLVEQLQRLGDQPLLDAGEMHLDDRRHGVGIGKADVVEEAAAQERVRQFLLVVRGDDRRSAAAAPSRSRRSRRRRTPCDRARAAGRSGNSMSALSISSISSTGRSSATKASHSLPRLM